MSDKVLRRIQSIIQCDVNHRGLATDPVDNLLTACEGDFAGACELLQRTSDVRIVTGFYIPAAQAAETDGPFGALFLAQVLSRLGKKARIITDGYCCDALTRAIALVPPAEPGRKFLRNESDVIESLKAPTFPIEVGSFRESPHDPRWKFAGCLIAIERAGPSHTLESLQQQTRVGASPLGEFLRESPREHWNQYHTMRGQVITDKMFPAHLAFDDECRNKYGYFTIGIGDGGNEIGMGKIPWETIARNVPGGGLVACRVPTDYNIVCGVSNWGAYGLAAGVWHLRGMPFDEQLFSADRERELWEKVLKQAVLVDGVTGQRTLTVDGLSWEDYIQPLREIAAVLKESS